MTRFAWKKNIYILSARLKSPETKEKSLSTKTIPVVTSHAYSWSARAARIPKTGVTDFLRVLDKSFFFLGAVITLTRIV